MPVATPSQKRAWLTRAITTAGEVYGVMRTIMTLASLLGEEYRDEELDIISDCEDVNTRVIRILDRLEEIDRQLTVED
ncbi:hypothetical protein ES708_34119 [subsurface metagenome]